MLLPPVEGGSEQPHCCFAPEFATDREASEIDAPSGRGLGAAVMHERERAQARRQRGTILGTGTDILAQGRAAPCQIRPRAGLAREELPEPAQTPAT